MFRAKAALEAEIKKKDNELTSSQAQLEEEQEANQKKDRLIKDLNNRIHDLEEEVEVFIDTTLLNFIWNCQ